MKDAHYAKTNEKSISRFAFFELWLIAFTIFGDSPEFPSESMAKKKTSFNSGQIYRKDVQSAKTNK